MGAVLVLIALHLAIKTFAFAKRLSTNLSHLHLFVLSVPSALFVS
jgi:hypothetical protein